MENFLPVLQVGAEPHPEIHRILKDNGWPTEHAPTIEQSLLAIQKKPFFLVIITARQLPCGPWHKLLDGFRGMAVPPLVIVTDHLADDRLWADVLNRGGYDVLAQPLDKREVSRVVRQAWLQWNNPR